MVEPTATKATATKRVLIVDDDEPVRKILGECFASFRHGHAYDVTTTASSGEAFQLLRREEFDLVLLDVVMTSPWVWVRNLGLSLLKRLREIGVTTPVLIMTTGPNNAAQAAAALSAGAAGYLYKPLVIRDLDEVVARVLR